MNPNYDLLDEIVSVRGTNKKIELLREVVKDDDTRNYVDLIYNNDVYGIAEISIDKAMKNSNKLFVDKFSILEQLEKTKNRSGNEQIDDLMSFFSYQTTQSKKWFKRVLLKEFPTVGIKSYNKARIKEGFEPLEVFELQLCESVLLNVKGEVIDWNGLDVNKKNYVQHKFDGNRAYLIKNGSIVSIISRNGKEILSLRYLKENILNNYSKDDFIIDGEIIDRYDNFNELSTKIRRLKDIPISEFKYKVFDIIEFNNKDFKNKIQSERHQFLNNYFKDDVMIQVANTHITHSGEEIEKVFNDIVIAGGEGIIIKPEDGLYEYGSRKYWWKMKPVFEGTFEIFDVEMGSGKYLGKISALWIKDKYSSVKCKVGSGLTELDVEDLTNMGRESIIGKFVDIFYSEIGPKGLRFPRFKEPNKENQIRNIRWRVDKEEADDLIPLKTKYDMLREEKKENVINVEEEENLNW